MQPVHCKSFKAKNKYSHPYVLMISADRPPTGLKSKLCLSGYHTIHMTAKILEDIQFLSIYKDSFQVRRWEESRLYRYCLLVPTEMGHQTFGVIILDPAGFELFLYGCYGRRFPSPVDALTAAIRAVDQHITEALEGELEGL